MLSPNNDMKFSYSKWMCHSCSRYGNPYKGFGAETKSFDEKYSEKLKCEMCEKEDWFLIRYFIPEKDIRFLEYYEVTINGVPVMNAEKTGRLRLRHRASSPERESFEKAKELGFNVHTQKDWWFNFGAWVDTISWEYSSELVSDDIWKAFEIFIQKPVRRAIFKSEFVDCSPDDPEAISPSYPKKQINMRVEYY